MGCRKCGSDWKTATGRDCQSCPHCNKLQRHLARKAGRWVEATEQAICKTCGKEFTNVGANVGKAKCCSLECKNACRKSWHAAYMAEYKKEYKKGRLKGTQASGRPMPTCKRCGQQFKRKHGGNNANLYCNKKCFFEARNAGDHAWDTTNQRKAVWHRFGRYASAPSAVLMRLITAGHAAIEWAGNGMCRLTEKEFARPTCEQCGCPCKDGASRFCSYACTKAWRGERQCKCGAIVKNAKANGVAWCETCRLKAKQKYRRQYKRELGSHRKKVRKGGGFWNSQVKRSIVFRKDKHRCYICKAKCRTDNEWNHPLAATVDMVVPASKGGDWDYHNLRCACRGCNSHKSDRLVGQMTLSLRR